MTYKLKKSVKYKLKNKRKYKTKNNYGVQQIVKINLTKTKRKQRRKSINKKPILSNVQSSMSLNPVPQTFNDTITSHKLSLLELEALETKNNLIELQKSKPVGAIENEKYLMLQDRLSEKLDNFIDEYNDTKYKSGLMFGKIGTELDYLRKHPKITETETDDPTFYTPKEKIEPAEETEPVASSSSAPPPPDKPEDKPEEEKPEEEPEEEPEPEEKPRTVYFNETSMKSNISKILGVSVQAELRKKLSIEEMTVPQFVHKMYIEVPDIGFTESKTERNELVKDYVKKYLGKTNKKRK